jgi:hypothetical protein
MQSKPLPASAAPVLQSAYIYGYPIVDGYNILYNYSLDPASPECKGPMNAVHHSRTVATPADRAIIANVHRIQDGFRVEPLSAFLGTAPPPPRRLPRTRPAPVDQRARADRCCHPGNHRPSRRRPWRVREADPGRTPPTAMRP